MTENPPAKPKQRRWARFGAWQQSVVGGSMLTFSSQAILFGLYFPLSVILARTLLPAGRGEYALIVLVPSLLLLFLDPGMGNASVYLIGQRRFPLMQAAPVLFYAAFAIGALGFGIFALVAQFPALLLAVGIGPDHTRLLWMGIGLLPFMLLSQYFSSLLLSLNRMLAFNATRILAIAAQLIIVLLCVGLGTFNLFWAVVSYSVATLISACCTLWLVARAGALNIAPRWSRSDLAFIRAATMFGMKGYLGRVLPFLGYRLDVFLIAAFLSTTDLGVYAVAVALAERIWTVADAVSTVLFPRIAAAGERDGVELTTLASRHVVLLVGLAATALAVLSRPLILLLYGSAYSDAVLAFAVLLPGVVVLSVGKIVSSYISGKGRPELGVLPAVLTVVSNTLLNLVLIPRLGIVGASLASTISYTLSAALLVVYFLRLSDARLTDLFVIRRSDLVPYRHALGLTYRKLTRQSVGPGR